MAIVIIGGGHGAGQAAANLRQQGYGGPIALVADEPHLPYQRPPLSKHYLAGDQDISKVHLRPAKFYRDKNIELRLGVRALAIDARAKTVACDDGSTLRYDKLLLATGARVRALAAQGGDLDGVHYVRTIADSDGLKRAFAPGRRIAIVGGGYVGLEVAAVARKAGLRVTVLEREERILQRVATPFMSAFYQELHAARGVVVRTGMAAQSFVGADGRLTGIVCAGSGGRETVAADLAVVGIGVLPNVELAEAAGLACDDGIVVDEATRTADPDIHAIGDCTNHPNPILGRRLRLESVPNAVEQSHVAAANMLGKAQTYASVPWFWSDQYDLKLQMVGFATDGERQVLRGDPETQRFAAFHLRGDTLAAADAVNSPREFMAARQLVGKRVDAAQLADPAADLRAIVAAAR